ncbi:organic cation transporter protein-like isoform X1 [Octopus sinensis]|uniref:Organic cation transporter protein-like isoform X1 n=1 Tax=Octopus sinensis TaxID=2607531 RepID=A0A6P7T1L7_9MOLL|nr:organic cation transporter protein-like isoform X1 [Octopus sinensis]
METKATNLRELNKKSSVEELKDSSISEITEEILKTCGGYGLYQKTLNIFIFIFITLNGLSLMTMVFIREKVPFACYPSNFNESLIPPNITLDEFLNKAAVEDEKCSVYNLDTKEGFYILPTSNSTKESCNNGRKFYSDDLSSIVSEFDLACEKEWLKNLPVSVMFTGFLFGNLLFGIISDKFGRFKAFCVSDILCIGSAFAKIYSPNYIVFVIIYFFEGFGYAGTYVVAFTMAIEYVSQNYRLSLNFSLHAFFAVGETLLAGVAYLLRKWQHLLYAATIPHILVLIIALKYHPESPRWLLNKGRFTESEESFKRLARINGKNPENAINLIRKLQREAELEFKFESEAVESTNLGNEERTRKKTYTAMDLLKKPRRAMISINLWFNWFVNSMLYYGVILNSVDMSGSRYMNFFIMALIGIPANIIGYLFFKWFGHRKPLCVLMVFGGFNCIVSNFVPAGNLWFPLILAVIGRLALTASFSGIYLTSAELFPTVTRNSGLSAASLFARVGGVFSPTILQLSTYGSWIPLSVYGVFGIAAGLLILLLPEMKDSCLLQTLDDMDNL